MAIQQNAFPTLDDYIRSRRATYRADMYKAATIRAIQSRWDGRVLPNRWHLMGERGAEEYIKKYAKTALAPKLIHLALYAEDQGYPDMARGFWKKAMHVEGAQIVASAPSQAQPQASTSGLRNPAPPQVQAFFGAGKKGKQKPQVQPGPEPPAAPKRAPAQTVRRTPPPFSPVRNLPDHLQPGKLLTLTPKPSPLKLSALIDSPEYVAFPLRPAQRVIIGLGSGWAFFQGAKGENLESVPEAITDGLMAAKAVHGDLIVEGEISYLDCEGEYHADAESAQAVNVQRGSKAAAVMHFSLRRALLTRNGDLTAVNEAARLETATKIGRLLSNYDPEVFELAEPVSVPDGKAALAQQGSVLWVQTGRGYQDPGGVFLTEKQ